MSTPRPYYVATPQGRALLAARTDVDTALRTSVMLLKSVGMFACANDFENLGRLARLIAERHEKRLREKERKAPE